MKIAVIGAGAIGGLVAGYLKLKGEDVCLLARPQTARAIKDSGLTISGCRGEFKINLEAVESLLSPPDLAILAVKSQDIEEVLKSNFEFLKEAAILTTQNGIQADNIASRYLPKENISSSIVMFGSTSLAPGKIVHNFEGSWILGGIFKDQRPNLPAGQAGTKDQNERLQRISVILNTIFPVIVSDDIQGMKYLKIFVNASNCIPAILGVSMQEAFADINVSRASISIWKEGLETVNKAGIELKSLPDFPLERLIKLTSLPEMEAAKIFSGIMQGLSKEPLYGSILQSIKKGRPSEIDYINGEFVHIAKERKFNAPLNEKLVELVHQVERTGKFFSKEELLNNVKGLFN